MSKKGQKVHTKKVFKPYVQEQQTLPLSIDSLIPQNHVVRVVNRAIDRMNLEPLFAKYPGGGRSSFHPVMMTKLLVYAYTDRVFSCRRIAKAARENIMYMWLCGGNQPDFMSVNRFRSERMKEVILEVFAEVIELLVKEKYIKLENYFLDGTKIEANANKYSWVWGKSTKRYKEALREKCRELFKEIDQINEEENAEYGDSDLEELGNGKPIDSEAIEEAVRKIDERLAKKSEEETVDAETKKLKKTRNTLTKDYLPRMQKYEQQELILEERNSYSKTDHDATFMRMKEDHMKNGQLKPGYNVQIGTENQFVVGYSVHQRPGDTSCMKDHLEELKTLLHGELPKNIIADAGYGSEENYDYLQEKKLVSYVKYNTFHKEASKKWKEDITKPQNFTYDHENDEYICGYGRTLIFLYERHQKSDNGYRSLIRIYECLNCSGCPHRNQCVKSSDPYANRRIYVNRKLNAYKEQARRNLCSEEGLRMRSLRPVEVESVFGDIKGNHGMRRFLLKGLEKVKIEWGLHCIAHNMRKMALITG
ncbi:MULTISPECIES: IS1182 family transposase [unclassified Dehalobacter]|jgi:transposase|nr:MULTISPECIES: IS1182 family transposase [unclassified Dehalobacter]AFV01525.1 ISPsy6, transposase [Dehalobacter sp. DCA]AFV01565.1 ISPsy6, transposase [Dehalobacter sp. DCA]AFV02683.1 ISPsy6, transposase [Dehalobacter sp. DCA]AFV03386.1 transposase (08) [Dehalobacter sp. DCA]AFV04559.1 Transposase, IS4 family [Dehalobacter sp. CF]